MKEKEILRAVEINNDLDVLDVVTIKHPKNPDKVYVPSMVVKMHCDDGEWRDGVVYRNEHVKAGEEVYCRRADDFAKFVEVV